MELHQQAYLEEAKELLSDLEHALLELEEKPKNDETIHRVFRILHTIKGSGAMFGFDTVAEFTHQVETIFDLVRAGSIEVSKDLISLTLAAGDEIKKLIKGQEASPAIIAALQKWQPAPESRINDRPEADTNLQELTYQINFQPHRHIFENGTKPILLLDELRGLGTCHIIAHTENIPDLDQINSEVCYTHWEILLTTKAVLNSIKDVFIFVEADCDLTIKPISDLKTDFTAQTQTIEIPILEQQKSPSETTDTTSVRVAAEKLDVLVNLVGELVTVQARLRQLSEKRADIDLEGVTQEVERLSNELRDNAMSIRMIPIGIVFKKFKRLIRDQAEKSAKEVMLAMTGEDTELDKSVIDRLNDPLVHIIRNCVDHGIEAPQIRLAQGKPRQGRILLSAEHSGVNVVITISDDGAGLDRELIRAKAEQKGLIKPGFPEDEILELIFKPGFSTAAKVTDLSGRGVGLDVVKRSIRALRGHVGIKSQAGEGTVITLTLPLTLAIIDGLLIQLDDHYFIVPLACVQECFKFSHNHAVQAQKQNLIPFRDQHIPFVRLRKLFKIQTEYLETESVIVIRFDDMYLGLGVDHVIGQHQTVLKSLGMLYKDVASVSGATILGDGSVALVLDIAQITEQIE